MQGDACSFARGYEIFRIVGAIALYIQKYVQYRKRKVFFGSTGRWPELVTVMAKHKTENYLVPLSDVHNDDVARMLDEKSSSTPNA